VTPLREQAPAATTAHQTAILKVHVIEQASSIDAGTPPIDDEAVMHKVTLRLLPYIGLLYMLCFLDRINLSNVHGTILNGTLSRYITISTFFWLECVEHCIFLYNCTTLCTRSINERERLFAGSQCVFRWLYFM
jgi:hypothetical protein